MLHLAKINFSDQEPTFLQNSWILAERKNTSEKSKVIVSHVIQSLIDQEAKNESYKMLAYDPFVGVA